MKSIKHTQSVRNRIYYYLVFISVAYIFAIAYYTKIFSHFIDEHRTHVNFDKVHTELTEAQRGKAF